MNKNFTKGSLISLLVVCATMFNSTVFGETTQFTDPSNGLLSWRSEEHGFSLQLIQLNPDYVTAVYDSRGLPQELIDGILKYCVFGTIVKNESDKIVTYKVAEWSYTTKDGKTHAIKPKSDWLKEWEAMGVGYRWSLLADDQTFSRGDWIQGFTTIDAKPGDSFDFHYEWTYDGKRYKNTIKGIRCATVDAKQK